MVNENFFFQKFNLIKKGNFMDRFKESSDYFSNKECLDKIFVYSGQNYSKNEADALKMLNDLSRTDRLILSKRKISGKKIKISMPTTSNDSNVNHELFIKNFNNSALACYLKLLEASDFWWNAYSLSPNQRYSTNFRSISSKIDASVDENLLDDEFVANYLNQMVKIHNQNTKKMNMTLNASRNKNDKCSVRHLYRSFRVLGLRRSSNCPKLNKIMYGRYGFNEIVDIRTTFNINLLNDHSGYEYSIDCELSYYQLKLKECTKCKYRSFKETLLTNNKKSNQKDDMNKKISINV